MCAEVRREAEEEAAGAAVKVKVATDGAAAAVKAAMEEAHAGAVRAMQDAHAGVLAETLVQARAEADAAMVKVDSQTREMREHLRVELREEVGREVLDRSREVDPEP